MLASYLFPLEENTKTLYNCKMTNPTNTFISFNGQ